MPQSGGSWPAIASSMHPRQQQHDLRIVTSKRGAETAFDGSVDGWTHSPNQKTQATTTPHHRSTPSRRVVPTQHTTKKSLRKQERGAVVFPHPDETEEGKDGPKERNQDGARRQYGQGDDVPPPVLLLLVLLGPSGQPNRHSHHQHLPGVELSGGATTRKSRQCHSCGLREKVTDRRRNRPRLAWLRDTRT